MTPDEAQKLLGAWQEHHGMNLYDALHTIATEPERIAEAERRGAVRALRAVADEGRRMPLYELRDRADAIENGADL